MKKIIATASLILLLGTTWYFTIHEDVPVKKNRKGLLAFDWWYDQRAMPGNIIQPDGLGKAYEKTRRTMALQKRAAEEPWESIGPDNIGGRVLALALDPDSANVLWAGSASGGLWRSRTGGAGADAWDYVNTGFNVLSVSTIAINPLNPNEMYIGTGEISGYDLGLVGTPGARTTYGLGIVKSTDRGATWSATGLTWLFSQNRSVQKVIVNPKNPKTVFAATSEGTYRSLNGGTTFTLVDPTLMAMDVAINHIDTTIVYIACGQRNTAPNPGLYKSTNGGSSFVKMAGGLPASNIGRTSLAVAPSDPNTVYASIANASNHSLLGLYRTTNSGTSWELMSTVNYLSGQGWYNNIVAVHPTNPAIVIGAGLDAYKSSSGGSNLVQKSFWYKGVDGVVPPGGTEGSDNTYAHADHHAIIYDPANPSRVFFGNDGGIFESTDGGESFIGRNGGFVTTQFYNGFANAVNDSMIALGGLQDNGTVKFQGGMSWNKVYGGDGGWCAVDPNNPNILYEEYVNLSISKSTDGGLNWTNIFNPASTDSANFIAPFVLSPSNSQVLYAGAEKIHKSTDAGATWFATNNNTPLNSVSAACLAVSFTSPDTVIAGTGKRAHMLFELFYTTNGGVSWTKSAAGTPNRYPTDISFDPSDSRVAYATFSGYGTPHVFKSTNAGASWTNISSNLPDLPVQSVCVDPQNPTDIYLGTDLGVYRTTNGGSSWEPWFDGMPYAMILDVSVSVKDRRLRAATFGNGVYQRRLRPKQIAGVTLADAAVPQQFLLEQNYPNPFNPTTAIRFQLTTQGLARLVIHDAAGREAATLVNEVKAPGTYSVQWNASGLASGTYFATLQSGGRTQTRKMVLMK
ncbi:MAG: T9SS type A sorting domain-containing protein [Bacteroidetes bacterium]|nr:T9SS type A sorting domain-containing protein [Bacteroidota bacterium]